MNKLKAKLNAEIEILEEREKQVITKETMGPIEETVETIETKFISYMLVELIKTINTRYITKSKIKSSLV